MAPSQVFHAGRDRARSEERSRQVDPQHLLPLRKLHVERPRARKNSGVVDEAVRLAPGLLEGGHRGLDGIAIADIDGPGARRRALFMTELRGLLDAVALDVPDCEMNTGRGEVQRHRAADALSGARHDDSLG
jgi:hypothetical protein